MNDCPALRHEYDKEPPQVIPHGHLCNPCVCGLRRDLRRLPSLARELEQHLDPRRHSNCGRGSGDGLPYHDPAAECISQIFHDAEVWVKWIIDERQPAAWPTLTLPAMLGWLCAQVQWAAYRPWVVEFAAAMAGNRGRAMALIDPLPRADIPIPAEYNYCPACGETGALYATIYQADGDKRPSMVTCGSCLNEWDTVQWMRLGRIILTWASDRRKAA